MQKSPPFSRLLLIGALAGIAGTAAMTSAMQRMFKRLPPDERYPLPPRELTDRVSTRSKPASSDAVLANHFAFGAAAGAALIAARPKSLATGAAGGVAVWALSYLGWVPGLKLLRPATTHPLTRNALMISAHLIWGAVTTTVARELEAASQGALAPGPLTDAVPEPAFTTATDA
jgi:hypothetical protein